MNKNKAAMDKWNEDKKKVSNIRVGGVKCEKAENIWGTEEKENFRLILK